MTGEKLIENYYGIHSKPKTLWNPQANFIVELIHQVLYKVIRLFKPENNYIVEDELCKVILFVV